MTADRARGALAVLQDADGKFICEVPCGYIVEQTVALRKESVDRNSEDWLNAGSLSRSLSARRAWIEIRAYITTITICIVALRKESVDRNVFLTLTVRNVPIVALRKESVDRNVNLRVLDGSKSVALRKESVDRNTQRRDFKALGLVALRKESVDRN